MAMRIMNDVPLKFLYVCMCCYMHCIVVDVADSRMISLQCLSLIEIDTNKYCLKYLPVIII